MPSRPSTACGRRQGRHEWPESQHTASALLPLAEGTKGCVRCMAAAPSRAQQLTMALLRCRCRLPASTVERSGGRQLGALASLAHGLGHMPLNDAVRQGQAGRQQNATRAMQQQLTHVNVHHGAWLNCCLQANTREHLQHRVVCRPPAAAAARPALFHSGAASGNRHPASDMQTNGQGHLGLKSALRATAGRLAWRPGVPCYAGEDGRRPEDCAEKRWGQRTRPVISRRPLRADVCSPSMLTSLCASCLTVHTDGSQSCVENMP